MKRKFWTILAMAVAAFLLGLCLYLLFSPKVYHAEKIDPRTLHANPANKIMLLGLWQNDENVFYRFNEDGTGCTWDTDDDVSEEEASPFNWVAYDNKLMITHRMVFRGMVPRYYDLDCLNAFDLRFHDDYSSFVFERHEAGIE